VPLLPVPGAALRAALGFPQQGTSSTTVRGVARPAPTPLVSSLSPCKASQCNAAGLLRQGPASLRAPAGQPPRAGRQRGQEGVSGKHRCWRTAVAGPARAGRDAGAGWRNIVGATCPHTPRRSLRSAVGRTVFYCRAVCGRAPVAGPCPCPLTASRGRGEHDGCWPLTAASGCWLLRRFFFLLKTRNVILAGPRQGRASRRSVRQRTLDMA